MAIERAQALVIEDSPEITLLVRGLLEKEGYSVVATPRGTQGLEWARSKKPELVILDLSLPDREIEYFKGLKAQLKKNHGKESDEAIKADLQKQQDKIDDTLKTIEGGIHIVHILEQLEGK